MESIERNMSIIFNVSEEEKKKIQMDARSIGMTTSSYCRWMLIHGKDKED